jgi:hypothetical protein
MTGPTGPTGSSHPNLPTGPLGPTGNIEIYKDAQGQLIPVVSDREVQHYFITEVELRMLERGSGNVDRTVAGVAFGSSLTCGISVLTTHGLGPSAHASLVLGFWTLLVGTLYSGLRAWQARSQNQTVAADVRTKRLNNETSVITSTAIKAGKSWKIRSPLTRNDS